MSTELNDGMITREELGSWLWGAADILRGAVSADDYGNFILPLLFFKRLSDVYDYEYNKNIEKYGDKFAGHEMFYSYVIPEGCHWEDVRNTATNVGSKLNEVLNRIAREDPKFDRVINRTDFNNPNAIPEERLVRLIEHFSKKNLSNGNVSPDMLGDGYEYLLKKFNEVAPTRAGEFYTPREVVKVLVGCLKPEEEMKVYDPCCGSGGMLIESYYYVEKHEGNPKKLFLFGQELNDNTWAIAKMNEYLHGMEARIEQGDTFVNPKFLYDSGGLQQFDIVIANPMWNQKGFKRYQENDRFGRFTYGLTNDSSADWGWIQHMLASLNSKGRMGIVLDQGALFRGGVEGSIREGVLRCGLIECVVALPEKLFYNTGAPGCLIFLNKNKPVERRGKVLFIYATESYEKLSNMNQLRQSGIDKIIQTFDGFRNVDQYSRVVELDEIKENDYNLSVTRYVDIFDQPEPVDIQHVWNELMELEKQRQQTTEKLAQYLKELGYGQ